MLCADCDNATAARRAEQVRRRLGQMPQREAPGGTRSPPASASPRSSPATRPRPCSAAPTARCFMAKQKGRNTVVQLGERLGTREPDAARRAARRPRTTPGAGAESGDSRPDRRGRGEAPRVRRRPPGKIVKIDGSDVDLRVEERRKGSLRPFGERPIGFCIHLQFAEERLEKPGPSASDPGTSGTMVAATRTRIRVAVTPQRNRDRRRTDVQSRARDVLISLRSYLMAVEEETPAAEGVFWRAVRILTPWLLKGSRQ